MQYDILLGTIFTNIHAITRYYKTFRMLEFKNTRENVIRECNIR
jgi:hypothetical protein